jgi:hypothetical protein
MHKCWWGRGEASQASASAPGFLETEIKIKIEKGSKY